MRTDGVNLSQEATDDIRGAISSMYGDGLMPPAPRAYKSKAKNAQVRHSF